jgi:tripartite-type tricarboxylate transporter receptor subunit TctC
LRSVTSLAIAAAASFLIIAPGAFAQAYPARPITMVVPFSPGGPGDILARIIAPPMSSRLGQPIVVDNRPGAGSTLGGEAVAKAPADGHTLLLGSAATYAVAPHVYARLAYDPNTSFAPIGLVAQAPFLLAVHPSVPAGTLKELIELARNRPNQLHYGSTGNGTLVHLAGEILKSLAGVELVHVPYKGVAGAVTDLVAGRVQLMFEQPSAFLSHIQAGRLRPLALSSPERFDGLPDVPTMKEAGLPEYDVTAWLGLATARGTPAAIVKRLNEELRQVLADPKVRESLARQGLKPAAGSPEEFAAYIRRENDKFARAVKLSGTKVD